MNDYRLSRSLIAFCAWLACMSFAVPQAVAQSGEDKQNLGPKEDVADMRLMDLLDKKMDRSTVPGLGHTHDRGEMMLGYTLMFGFMRGNVDGTNPVSPRQVVTPSDDGGLGYLASPTDMQMTMHMFRFMYAPIQRITIGAMWHFSEKSMTHITRAGGGFVTHASGFGDPMLRVFVRLLDGSNHRIHATVGGTFPVGSTGVTDDTAAADDAPLPYPMQLGTGTFGLSGSATYRGFAESYGWGAELGANVPVGENSRGYRVGREYRGTGWFSFLWTNTMSSFGQFKLEVTEDIEGEDSRLNPSMVPTADPSLMASEVLTGALGLAFDGALESPLAGWRLEALVGMPFYQRFDGPQLETDISVEVTLRYEFRVHD